MHSRPDNLKMRSSRAYLIKAVYLAALYIILLASPCPAASDKTCRQQIAPAIKEIDVTIQELFKTVPGWGRGKQVSVGSCASRMKKLAGNALCCSTFENTAAIWEEISCLKLKKYYLEKTCSCSTKGMAYSPDEALQDKTLEIAALAKKLKDKAIEHGITDAVISEYVSRISDAVDCVNLQSLETLRRTMNNIEEMIKDPTVRFVGKKSTGNATSYSTSPSAPLSASKPDSIIVPSVLVFSGPPPDPNRYKWDSTLSKTEQNGGILYYACKTDKKAYCLKVDLKNKKAYDRDGNIVEYPKFKNGSMIELAPE